MKALSEIVSAAVLLAVLVTLPATLITLRQTADRAAASIPHHTTADRLFLRTEWGWHRLGVGHAGGRVGFTDREIGVDDPVLLGILGAMPEDGRVGRAQRDAFARVMGVNFRRQ